MKSRWWKFSGLAGALLFLLALPGISTAAVQNKIYQCANYKAGTGDHDTCESWINGNINEQKAFYFEGDSVAYRLHVTGLTIGHSYTATIEWDATQGDKNALDYITTVNRTVDQADPCQDLTISGGCDKNSPDDTWLIPVDAELEKGRDQTAATADDITQETPHHFRMWNGDITGVGSYVYDPDPWDYLSSTMISIPITFTAQASDVLLAWGGHISTRMDWGETNSAINISGSPYHMRLLFIVDHDDGDDIVSQGNRDLQLSASAVFFPISLTIEKTTDVESGDPLFDFTSNLASPDDAFSLQGCSEGVGDNCTTTLAVAQSDISVTEIEPGELWDLDSIVCDDLTTEEPNDQSFTLINTGLGASLTLAEGAIVKCTFHNVFVGEPLLVVEKKVVEADGTCLASDEFYENSDNESLEIASGDQVKYCYRVKNTGTAPAYNVTLTDDAGGLTTPFNVPLSGGDIANLDGGGQLNDLDGFGAKTFGEALVVINETTGTTVTNIATADADNADEDTDDAEVVVVDRADCMVTATVTAGACPGSSNTIDVVTDTAVNWCAEVCWPSTANSSLSTTVELLDGNSDPLEPPVSSGPVNIAPDSCQSFTLPETLGSDSVERILKASGTDGFGNSETCQAGAAADVFNPSIDIEKTVSLNNVCGDGDDAESKEVYTGTEVWYCFTVTNNGDEPLTNIVVNDATLGLVNVAVPDLPAGNDYTFLSDGNYERTFDVNNTAIVNGTGSLTSTAVSDQDTAIVTVVYADVIVEKSGTEVIDLEGDLAIQYTIFVWNNGTTTAIDVELSDPLPDQFVYLNDDSGGDCVYNAGSLECELGDIEPGMGNGVTIHVNGEFSGEGFDPLVNEACAWPDNNLTPDVDLSNNCDDTTTTISTGATRTIGWWGNHPDMMEACLDANEGLIDELGEDFLLQTVEDAIGIIKTNIAHDLCKDKRDELTKARLQAGRQLLAAVCNVTYLGTAAPDWLEGAQEIMEGDDIQAILELGGLADEFNNSGDDEPLPGGIEPAPANPHFAWTDPTSPEECTGKARGKRDEIAGTGGCAIGSVNGMGVVLPLLFIASVAVILIRRKKKMANDDNK